jgi:hypothetical protein
MKKAKIFTSSPFSIDVKALAGQWWFESINAYAASLTDFLMAASFRKAAFRIISFKISIRYKGSGPAYTTLILDGIPLILFSQLPVILRLDSPFRM